MKAHKVIDLFAGAGGLSFGFEQAGFKTVFAVENNKIFAKSFKSNFPKAEIYVGDIKKITNKQIETINKKYKPEIIIGGPPCQGFSIAGRVGRLFLDDDRNKLFLEYVRFVKIIKPKIFVIENVAAMMTHNKGRTMKEIISVFSNLGYDIKFDILNSVNYLVPQQRRRIFIIGTNKNIDFYFPKKIKKILTIKDAIDDLPKLNSGESSKNDKLHVAMSHSQQMLHKMKFVKDGGDRMDIPEEMRPKSGDARKYIRYNSKQPSFCITGDMRKIFHYHQNRALTCRELARLQTFPDSFIFCGNSIEIQQQIGNAVPCNLAYAVAKECLKGIKNEK